MPQNTVHAFWGFEADSQAHSNASTQIPAVGGASQVRPDWNLRPQLLREGSENRIFWAPADKDLLPEDSSSWGGKWGWERYYTPFEQPVGDRRVHEKVPNVSTNYVTSYPLPHTGRTNPLKTIYPASSRSLPGKMSHLTSISGYKDEVTCGLGYVALKSPMRRLEQLLEFDSHHEPL